MRNNRVAVHEHFVESLVGGKNRIFFTALYGSQNYNLDLPNSDVDTKTIYLPSKEELILAPRKNKVYSFENEKCEVKDFRDYLNCFRKPSINFLETLFTKDYYVNFVYDDLLDLLRENKEELVRANLYRFSRSVFFQALNTSKQNIKSFSFKKVSQVIFLQNFFDNFFIYDKSFEESLKAPTLAREVKKENFSFAEAQRFEQKALDDLEDSFERVSARYNVDQISHKQDRFLTDIAMQIAERIINEKLF